MRADAIGFFWQDLPPPKKEKKEVEKRVPPEPVWLRADYLPGLEEARRFPVQIMTDADVMESYRTKDRFTYDTECFQNYWCGVFVSINTGKVLVFEKHEHEIGFDNQELFHWIISNITIVTFNGIHYDLPMTTLALAGLECDQLKRCSDDLIVNGIEPWRVLKREGAKLLQCDQIDLKEVAPDRVGLKAYGGRMHVPRMADLPFDPHIRLNEDQITIVRWYCVNDNSSTAFLHETLKEQIDLRYLLTEETGIDLRSKSDAQIAEAMISAEYQGRTGKRAQRPQIEPGTVYRYEKPANLRFQTPQMQEVLRFVESLDFVIGRNGKVQNPTDLEKFTFKLGDGEYKMGVGGIHSKEKSIAHVTDEYWQLIDKDVTSYYPFIILNNMYFPEHLGPVFLEIFANIVRRRVNAKADGLKAIADALKIVINGTFGKLGSAWSIMYAPKLMFHTTISGQFYLMMLAEAYEMNGIHVVSANTDGIMIKCPKHLLTLCDEITKWWEKETGFKLEGKNYKALYSKDINNYIAVDEKLNVKSIGQYRNPWDDPKENKMFRLKKNPFTTICTFAIWEYLTKQKPLEQTIWECKDIRKFTAMRSVGKPKDAKEGDQIGAVKDGEFLGKQIRWYYSTRERGKEIVKAHNGHTIGRSEGARPLMQLPNEFPIDIDYDWYFAECKSMLGDIGAN